MIQTPCKLLCIHRNLNLQQCYSVVLLTQIYVYDENLPPEAGIIQTFKVRQPRITNLRVTWTDGRAMSKCTQDSQKVCVPNCFLYLIMPKKTQFLVPQLK